MAVYVHLLVSVCLRVLNENKKIKVSFYCKPPNFLHIHPVSSQPLFGPDVSFFRFSVLLHFPLHCSPKVFSWQVESGLFQESDVKAVGKSIRDRVSLIRWRRERAMSAEEGDKQKDGGSTLCRKVPWETSPPTVPDPQEPMADQPAGIPYITCKYNVTMHTYIFITCTF